MFIMPTLDRLVSRTPLPQAIQKDSSAPAAALGTSDLESSPAFQISLSNRSPRENPFLSRFRAAANASTAENAAHPDPADASFIEDFALTYRKLYEEIRSGKSDGSLTELDDAYIQATEKASDALAQSFLPYVPDSYGAVKTQLLNLSTRALEITLQNPTSRAAELKDMMAAELQQVKSTFNNKPVNLTYGDVKGLSTLIQSLPPLSMAYLPNETAQTVAQQMGRWYAAYKKVEKSLSPAVAATARTNINLHLQTFKLMKAFQHRTKNLETALTELNEKLDKLSKQFKKLEKDLKPMLQAKDKNMQQISRLLKQQQECSAEMAALRAQIKTISDQQSELNDHPETIKDSEEYQGIDTAFKTIQSGIDYNS